MAFSSRTPTPQFEELGEGGDEGDEPDEPPDPDLDPDQQSELLFDFEDDATNNINNNNGATDAMELDQEHEMHFDGETVSGDSGGGAAFTLDDDLEHDPEINMEHNHDQEQEQEQEQVDGDVVLVREAQRCLARLEQLVSLSQALRPELLQDSAQGKASHLLLARYHAHMFLFRYAVALGLAQEEPEAEGTLEATVAEATQLIPSMVSPLAPPPPTPSAPMFTTIDISALAQDAPPSFDFAASAHSHSQAHAHSLKKRGKDKEAQHKDKDVDKEVQGHSPKEAHGHGHGHGGSNGVKARAVYESSAVFRVNPQTSSAKEGAALLSVFSLHPRTLPSQSQPQPHAHSQAHAHVHTQARTSTAHVKAQHASAHAGATARPQAVITKPRHPHKARKKIKPLRQHSAAHHPHLQQQGHGQGQ